MKANSNVNMWKIHDVNIICDNRKLFSLLLLIHAYTFSVVFSTQKKHIELKILQTCLQKMSDDLGYQL